jgi:hypothetical protein
VRFDVPAAHEQLVLHYQPIRWGGADPVRIHLTTPRR